MDAGEPRVPVAASYLASHALPSATQVPDYSQGAKKGIGLTAVNIRPNETVIIGRHSVAKGVKPIDGVNTTISRKHLQVAPDSSSSAWRSPIPNQCFVGARRYGRRMSACS